VRHFFEIYAEMGNSSRIRTIARRRKFTWINIASSIYPSYPGTAKSSATRVYLK